MNVLDDLLIACKAGNLNVVQSFVSKDSALAIQSNHEGICALHSACLYGHINIVKYLLDKGASVHMRNTDGSSALTEAMYGGWIDLIEILLDNGALLNPPLQLSTPLHEAALAGKADCCKLLIYHGASLLASDCNYGNPLHAACHKGDLDVVKVLLDAGALVNATKTHATSLHMVADKHPQNYGLINLLCCYGANPWALNNNAKLPIDILEGKGCSNSATWQLLCDWMKCVPSLMVLCRRKVLKACIPQYRQSNNSQVLSQLPVPNSLKTYLDGNWLVE